MILNYKAAIEYLVRDTEHVGVDPETIIALHAFLADGLMPDPAACGRLCVRPVEIGGSVYLPIAMPQRSEELFGVMVEMAAEIRDPSEQSFPQQALPHPVIPRRSRALEPKAALACVGLVGADDGERDVAQH